MGKGKKLWGIILVVLILLSGCGKESVPMEDYVQSNPTTVNLKSGIMKSDTGYYYSTPSGHMSLHYFDEASGQNIYLCSKPECRHEGDAFCTATSEKYNVQSACFYGGALYLSVLEWTDTEVLYKLLRVSADGTELTELVTFMTINRTSVWIVEAESMVIHRGVVALSYQMLNKDDIEIGVTGTCFYNLNSGELRALPELEYGVYSQGRNRFTGFGDYIYYDTYFDNKHTLSRYSVTDGSVEELELQTGYNGTYEVIDEDTVYYLRAGGSLYEYQISTKQSGRLNGIFVNTYTMHLEEIEWETEREYQCTDMMTDGTYFYAGDGVFFRRLSTGYLGFFVDANGEETPIKSYVHVFDRELNEVAKVEIATEYYLDDEVTFSIAVLDDIVYLQTEQTIFSCTLEEFLAEEIPPFKPLYDIETGTN